MNLGTAATNHDDRRAAHPALVGWGLAVLGLVLGLSGATPAVAQGSCGGATPPGFAFARASPLQVAVAAGAPRDGRIDVAFGTAYPLFATNADTVGLCVEGQRYWVLRSHVFEVKQPEWVRIGQPGDGSDRPRVRFWRSQERLGAHLSVSDGPGQAPPDYEDVPVRATRGLPRLPVYSRELMAISLNQNQVTAASVLVPFAADAVVAYRAVRAIGEATALLLVDVSGSTEGQIAPFMRQLRDLGHPEEGAAATVRLLLIEVSGDGEITVSGPLSPAEVATRRWLTRPATTYPGREAAGFVEAARWLAPSARTLPAVVLAGGDVALRAEDWRGFNNLWVVQATPELEAVLRESVAGFVVGGRFLAYGVERSNALLQALAGAPGTASVGRYRANFEPVAERALAAGLLPLLPTDLDAAKELATPPPFATTGARWFAVPLWVVVDSLLLQFEQNQ